MTDRWTNGRQKYSRTVLTPPLLPIHSETIDKLNSSSIFISSFQIPSNKLADFRLSFGLVNTRDLSGIFIWSSPWKLAGL